jgi:hypothetical protein
LKRHAVFATRFSPRGFRQVVDRQVVARHRPRPRGDRSPTSQSQPRWGWFGQRAPGPPGSPHGTIGTRPAAAKHGRHTTAFPANPATPVDITPAYQWAPPPARHGSARIDLAGRVHRQAEPPHCGLQPAACSRDSARRGRGWQARQSGGGWRALRGVQRSSDLVIPGGLGVQPRALGGGLGTALPNGRQSRVLPVRPPALGQTGAGGPTDRLTRFGPWSDHCPALNHRPPLSARHRLESVVCDQLSCAARHCQVVCVGGPPFPQCLSCWARS